MARYKAIRTVGQGSFGAAILVIRDGAPFIAKEMNIGKMTPQERDSVDSEVKILSALQHPNIIRYEECVTAGATLYIVMEYADGGDLFHRISSLKEPMSEEAVLYIFAQICLAVKHLHSRRILHRDLKSQNVFLTRANVVKLGDFGLATALRHTYQIAKSLCGTPNYFSPELVQGRPFNNKSDIWAMGCILYELVTQRFAFPGVNIPEIMQRILNDQPAPVPGHYTDGLKSILCRMLCKEQAIRPSIEALMRANVLKDALHRIQKTLQEGQIPFVGDSGVMEHKMSTDAPEGCDDNEADQREDRNSSHISPSYYYERSGGASKQHRDREEEEKRSYGREDEDVPVRAHVDHRMHVKSPPHPYVKEEELEQLEKDILV